MYVQTITQFPLPGKGPELRAAMEERVRALQAAGVEAQLTVTAWGAESQGYRIGTRWNSLADLERQRASSAEAAAQFVVRIGPLVRQAPVVALGEMLSRTNVPTTPMKWQQHVVAVPALGKAAELRALQLERSKYHEAAGLRTVLIVQVAGPEAGCFSRVLLYNDLTEFEEARARIAADDANQAFLSKFTALLSRPSEVEFREVLVPIQQR